MIIHKLVQFSKDNFFLHYPTRDLHRKPRPVGVGSHYCKHGKICWAKHSRFQPDERFHGNIIAVPWPVVFII